MLSDLSFRYDFTCSNMNDDNLSKMNAERIPDVVSIGAAWFCEHTLYTILKFIVNTPLNIHVHVSDIGMVFPNNGYLFYHWMDAFSKSHVQSQGWTFTTS